MKTLLFFEHCTSTVDITWPRYYIHSSGSSVGRASRRSWVRAPLCVNIFFLSSTTMLSGRSCGLWHYNAAYGLPLLSSLIIIIERSGVSHLTTLQNIVLAVGISQLEEHLTFKLKQKVKCSSSAVGKQYFWSHWCGLYNGTSGIVQASKQFT